MLHRSSQKRVYGNHVSFITCNVSGLYQFFKDVRFCEVWIQELILSKLKYNPKIIAFCLNYDHFHIFDENGYEIWKTFTSDAIS